jgi:transposase-like protein
MAILPRRARRGGGALRAAPVPNTNKETLLPYILTNVQRGSVVNTDEASAYKTIEQVGPHRTLRLIIGPVAGFDDLGLGCTDVEGPDSHGR